MSVSQRKFSFFSGTCDPSMWADTSKSSLCHSVMFCISFLCLYNRYFEFLAVSTCLSRQTLQYYCKSCSVKELCLFYLGCITFHLPWFREMVPDMLLRIAYSYHVEQPWTVLSFSWGQQILTSPSNFTLSICVYTAVPYFYPYTY